VNDDRISVLQTMAFPTVYSRRRQMLKHSAAGVLWEQSLQERELRMQVGQSYHEVLVLSAQVALLKEADSIFTAATAGEEQRFDLGSSNSLQRATARSQGMLMRARVQQVIAELEQARTRLAQLMDAKTLPEPLPIPLKRVLTIRPDEAAVQRHPLVRAVMEQEAAADSRWRMERSTLLPDLSFGVSSMTLYQSPSVPDGSVIFGRNERFNMLRVGVGVPLFFGAQNARNKAARLGTERAGRETEALIQEIRTRMQQAQQRYDAQLARVNALEQGAAEEAGELRRAAEEAFSNGQIGRLEWSLLTGQSITLSMEYLDAQRALGRAAFELDAFNEQ
jgi:cobalt-zinc-cadmium resistance protein CzcA